MYSCYQRNALKINVIVIDYIYNASTLDKLQADKRVIIAACDFMTCGPKLRHLNGRSSRPERFIIWKVAAGG